MMNLADLSKSRVEELGSVPPKHAHTTRSKLTLLAYIDGLIESTSDKTIYLAFDDDVCEVFKTIYKKDYKEDAFIHSRAAAVIRKSLLQRETKEFDGEFHQKSQSSFVP